MWPRLWMIMTVMQRDQRSDHAAVDWVSINLEYGGMDVTPAAPLLQRHGSVDLSRLRQLPEVVMFPGRKPTLIFLQEGRGYDLAGKELLLYVERLLRYGGVGRYRGLLTRSLINDLHQVVFVDTDRVDVVHHWDGQDPAEGVRRYGYSELMFDGDEACRVKVKSVHLMGDGDERLRLVRLWDWSVKDGDRVIWCGDFNSSTSRRSRREGEPRRRFLEMAVRNRFHKGYWPPRARWWWGPARRGRGDTTADTRAVDYLLDTGWRDQHIEDGNSTPTVHEGVDRGGELIIDRCVTFGGLVTVPGSVVVDTVRQVSDHRAVAGSLLLV